MFRNPTCLLQTTPLLLIKNSYSTARAAASVKVLVNGVKSKLFNMAKKDIVLTMAATRAKLGITAAVNPDMQACLNLLLPFPFVAFMLDAMNRPQNSGPKLTPSHATVFLNVVLNLHHYRCSPGTLFAELAYGANSLYGLHPELVGAEVIFTRCLDGLSFVLNSEHRGLEWAESQTFDSTIHDAAKSKSFCVLCNQ